MQVVYICSPYCHAALPGRFAQCNKSYPSTGQKSGGIAVRVWTLIGNRPRSPTILGRAMTQVTRISSQASRCRIYDEPTGRTVTRLYL